MRILYLMKTELFLIKTIEFDNNLAPRQIPIIFYVRGRRHFLPIFLHSKLFFLLQLPYSFLRLSDHHFTRFATEYKTLLPFQNGPSAPHAYH